MQDKFLRKMLIENKLHKAIEENLFQLYFQPQFDVSSGALRGFEALLRWRDDELGWISPDQFIPLAEESRMVIPLGDWVMETAIKTLRQWENEFNFDGIMSVNVSPIQFKNENFIDSLIDKTKRYGINVSHLEIEITEGMLIDNIPDTVSKLNTIREMGIGISLDDFGTGYSSLAYLTYVPVEDVKLDKSLVDTYLCEGKEDFIKDVIQLVHDMGKSITIEGVEKDWQYNKLREFNADTIQGYYFSPPLDPEEAIDFKAE
jgi:EAL domain-containing protein (putative c-di-GMP-specific phosphodiesterase class I)